MAKKRTMKKIKWYALRFDYYKKGKLDYSVWLDGNGCWTEKEDDKCLYSELKNIKAIQARECNAETIIEVYELVKIKEIV